MEQQKDKMLELVWLLGTNVFQIFHFLNEASLRREKIISCSAKSSTIFFEVSQNDFY